MKDYYNILGCTPLDSKSKLHSEFKSRLYEEHKKNGDDRQKVIESITEAYEVLSRRKKQYDRLYSVRILNRNPKHLDEYKKFENKWIPRITSEAKEGILKGKRFSNMSESRLSIYFFFAPFRRFFEGLFDTISMLLDMT